MRAAEFKWYASGLQIVCDARGPDGQRKVAVVRWGGGDRNSHDDPRGPAIRFYFDGRLRKSWSKLALATSPTNLGRSISTVWAVDASRLVEATGRLEIMTVDRRILTFDITTGEKVASRNADGRERRIEGRVTNAWQEPIAGARVLALRHDEGQRESVADEVTTDAGGYFRLGPFWDGIYGVRVSRAGYETVEQQGLPLQALPAHLKFVLSWQPDPARRTLGGDSLDSPVEFSVEITEPTMIGVLALFGAEEARGSWTLPRGNRS